MRLGNSETGASNPRSRMATIKDGPYNVLIYIHLILVICEEISMRFDVKNLIGHVASTFMVDKPIKFHENVAKLTAN